MSLLWGASALTAAVSIRSIRQAYPNANPRQVWVDLCENHAAAFRIVKAFLKFYIASSNKKRLTAYLLPLQCLVTSLARPWMVPGGDAPW